MPNDHGADANEPAALLLSFQKLRILHYAETEPITRLSLLEKLQARGCSVSPPTLDRIILRMVRNGWLTSKKHHQSRRLDYSLTAKGRAALTFGRYQLRDVTHVLNCK